MTRLIDLDALPKDWQVEDVIFAPEVDAIPIAHIQRRRFRDLTRKKSAGKNSNK